LLTLKVEVLKPLTEKMYAASRSRCVLAHRIDAFLYLNAVNQKISQNQKHSTIAERCPNVLLPLQTKILITLKEEYP